MTTRERQSNPYRARYATFEDVGAIDAIVRQVFGAHSQSADVDMKKRNMTYMVVEQRAQSNQSNNGSRRNLRDWIKSVFSQEHKQGNDAHNIAGLVGIWAPLDQAHVMVVATRPEEQGRGIGELLIIATISEAKRIGAANATLEVRKSNQRAQALYRKYGFVEVGIRHNYYAENREDALIMTTPSLIDVNYSRNFDARKAAYFKRRGNARLQFND